MPSENNQREKVFDRGGEKRRRKAIVIQEYTKQLISPRKREREKRTIASIRLHH